MCLTFCPSIGAKDVYDGNLKLILGLVWILIQHFQICGHSKKDLLTWINTQIPDQSVKNFTTDWNDGVAICALVDHIEPGLCPHYATLNHESKFENCSLGINLAEEKLGILRIMEPDDLCHPDVDELSVMTYISSFCKPANDRLLKWIQSRIPDRNITNFDTDWHSGVNLACLLDAIMPGLFPNSRELNPEKALNNLTEAMKSGEKHLRVKPGFAPSKLADAKVDELSMATYLSRFRYAKRIPDVVKCTGHGLSKAFLGMPAVFKVDVTETGTDESDVKVTIFDSKNTSIKPQITPDGKGHLRVQYVPWSIGKLKVEIKWKNFAIPDSPFNVDVIDLKTLSFTSKDRCVKAGDVILMQAIGINNARDLSVFVQGANGETSFEMDYIERKSEGIVECSYSPTQLGKHKVVARCAGVEIPGSPLEIEVVDPKQYSVRMFEPSSGKNLTMNKPTVFVISTSEANLSCLVANVLIPGALEPKEINIFKQQGSYVGKFTPTEGGKYEILVTCAGENIHGSPIQLTASDPSRCLFLDNIPRFVQAGVPCEVNLSTKGAGPGTVTISSSQTEILAVSRISEADKDLCTIQMNPVRVGESTIDVKFGSVSLLPTPHTISVCDASKCIASGVVLESGCAKSNEPFEVKVQTKGAGKGELNIKFNHGPKTTYTRKPKDSSDGIYSFTLTPYEAGMHSLNILWGGVPIPNSPYSVKVNSDAVQFKASGNGLKEATAHKVAKFVLKGPQSGLLEEDILQVKIRDGQFESRMVSRESFNPTSEEALVCVTETQKGSYLVEYSVPADGNYTIFITVDGDPIPESPFNVKVYPTSICRAFGMAIENPNSLVLSKNIEFNVDTSYTGSGKLTAMATGPTSSKMTVSMTEHKSSWKKKIYVLKLNPKEIGEYNVSVYWNKEHIPGSPFSLEVCDPSKVKVLNLPESSNYVAEINKPLTFIVDAKDAGKGELKCTVKTLSIKDSKLHEVEPKMQDDGTFVLNYTPNEIGQMQLLLTYNGESIPPTPWECEIANPTPPQVIPLKSHGRQNEPVKFITSGLTESIMSKMTIDIFHPKHRDPTVQQEKHHESSTVYHFVPKHLGEYEVTVNVDGKAIHGSPFTVQVVNSEACIVKGEIPNTVSLQEGKQFTMDVSEAGPGELSFTTDDPSSNKLECKFNSTNPANTIVELNGKEAGKCTLYLKWGGYDIPNMPVDITVFDPMQCYFKCEQVEAGYIQTTDKVAVLINTAKGGNCEPTVKAEGPTAKYSVEMEKTEEGVYIASFTPHQDGCQTVRIFVDGVMLPNCPLKFETFKPIDTSTITLGGKGIKRATANQQNEIVISAGESKLFDKGQLDVDLKWEDSTDMVEFHVNDNQDGTYSILYEPERAGKLTMKLTYRGKQVGKGPHTIDVQLEPSTLEHGALAKAAVMYDVQVGVPFTIRVETKDAVKAQLQLKPVDPTKRYTVDVEEKQGEWRATCTAWDKGEQELQVLWAESEITGSPIRIFVGDQKRSSNWNPCKIACFILIAILLSLILLILLLIGYDIAGSKVKSV